MFQQQLSLEHAAGEAIGSLLEDLANQLQRPRPALQHPAVWLRQLRTVLAACLIYQPHNYSSLLTDGQSPQRPRHLRRVLEYAEAHLSEHLTLDVLADAAGCSARTLSTAFQTYLQVTPMTYVRNLRLDRVRRDLSIGNELVATVAYRWGFTHLGRFSSYYYQRFAERPSETLAREEQSSSPGGAFGTGRFDVKSA